MTMQQTRLSKQTFHCYLKLGIGIQVTKDGLQGIVEKETDELHRDILQQLQTKDPCSKCLTENVLDCPTVGLCKRKHCPFHSSTAKQPRACPYNACGIFRDRIREAFRYYKPNCTEPSWRNTNALQWASKPFQVMKCFLPPERYMNVNSVAELDLDGILDLMINNKRFNGMMTEDLSQEDNICVKAKSIGRIYSHSISLTISDTDLSAYLDLFITLLTNQKFLLHDWKAKQSVRLLQQLKEDSLQVSTSYVTAILNDAITSVEIDKQTKNQIPHKRTTGDDEERIAAMKLSVLRDAHESFSKESRKIKSNQLCVMVSQQNNAINKLKKAAMKLQETDESEYVYPLAAVPFRNDVPNENYESQRMETDIPLPPARKLSCRSSIAASFKQLKSELREDLITFYQERHSSLPLSPLIENNKASLLEFYVRPSIKLVGQNEGLLDGKFYKMYHDVNSLADVFATTTQPCRNSCLTSTSYKEKTVCKNICLTSPPGTGKTSFVKKMVQTWCQAHKPDTTNEIYFTKEDLETMRQYAFLFLIILRDARQECHQDDMIMNILINQLDRENHYEKEFLQQVLHEDKCIVVLDGLDEWRHPRKEIKSCKLGKSDFPHIKARKYCTTLSTTRPWTIRSGNAGLDIDKQLEIHGLEKDSSKKLIHNVIAHLNEKYETCSGKNAQDFLEMITLKGLKKFEANPVILMQLLCLWYEGTDPGISQCQIYSNMLELLFRRADKDSKSRKYPRRKGKHNMKLPACFAQNATCKENARLLMSLGVLAQETLFTARKGLYLVFDRSVARAHLEEPELQKCLAAGILSQSEKQEKITTSKITLTFLHKTFQEFLAALSIACKKRHTLPGETMMLDEYNSVKDILQLETILVFVSGLSPKILSDLSKRTSKIVANDCLTTQYRTNIGTLFLESRVLMNDYCSMLVKCVKESHLNEHEDIEVVHLEDVFIDDQCTDKEYVLALSRLIQMNTNSVKSVSIHVMQTVSDKCVKEIMQKLNMQSICSLEKLFIWGKIPLLLLQSLLQQSEHTIKNLELWGMTLYAEEVSNISKMANVEGLSFLSITMSHDVSERLLLDVGSRTKLRQINLHDIECTDHSESCHGLVMKMSEKAKPELLLLDKSYLKEIVLNTSNLEMCIVEWLPIPGALQSLLRCLASSTTLKRFECEGPAGDEDTESLVSAVSTLKHLEYLRLRNVRIDELKLDISHLHSLRRVHFSYVSMDSEEFRRVTHQIEMFPSPVMVFMEKCHVTPSEKYEKAKARLRSSNRFEVLSENDDKLYFKTTPSVNNVKTACQRGTLIGSEWEQCFCDDLEKARQIVGQLLKEGKLPNQSTVDKLCKKIGKKDRVFVKLCEGICAAIKEKSSRIVHVWPAYSSLSGCENTITFIVIINESLPPVDLDSIQYSVYVRQMGKCSSEGRHVMYDDKNTSPSAKDTENLKKCINRNAASLLEQHKLLSMIAPSAVRSKHYNESKEKTTLEREPCIVLYVYIKHYIPLDEEPFSKYYDGIPTDVREGLFVPQPTNPIPNDVQDTLKMGCQIGSDRNRNQAGTLGGFIEHPQYGLCGFTCAHCLLNQNDMERLRRTDTINWPDFSPDDTVYQPGGSVYAIGRLVRAVYKHGMVNNQSGLEVALFQIENRHPITGGFPVNGETRFDSGRVHGISRINNTPVIKYGSKTNKTTGEFILTEASTLVRTIQDTLNCGGYTLTLNNQLEIKARAVQQGTDQGKFSDYGDSGALVLMEDRAGDFTCVGMVEGITSNHTTIVTPITPILEALHVSKLKDFETKKLSQQIDKISSDIQAINETMGNIWQEIRNGRP